MVKIDVTFIAEGLERDFFVGKSSHSHLVCLSRNDSHLTRDIVWDVIPLLGRVLVHILSV